MTCIVGLVRDGEVWMGGDSCGTDGGHRSYLNTLPKVFRSGEFLVGYTSSFRMGQLLQFNFVPPTIEGDLYAYMATGFVDAVRECFKAGGHARKENEVESTGFFLVGVRGRLFSINDDYGVNEALEGYDAVGCGDQIALGAIYAVNVDRRPFLLNLPDQRPDAIIRIALEAAERFSAGVRGPFTVISTGKTVEKQEANVEKRGGTCPGCGAAL